MLQAGEALIHATGHVRSDRERAIIIGGTSVFGGKGSVLRTLLGVIFVSVLTNILVLSGIGFGFQQMAIGALIVVAVSVDALARRAAKK